MKKNASDITYKATHAEAVEQYDEAKASGADHFTMDKALSMIAHHVYRTREEAVCHIAQDATKR